MYYENFSRLCTERGVTASKVSKATGISTATLSNWKKGNYTPKQDKLQKIADYFEVSIDYLMTGSLPEDINPDNIARNENEKRLLISFRNAGNLTSEQMDELETLFSQSMDLYLKAKGLKK